MESAVCNGSLYKYEVHAAERVAGSMAFRVRFTFSPLGLTSSCRSGSVTSIFALDHFHLKFDGSRALSLLDPCKGPVRMGTSLILTFYLFYFKNISRDNTQLRPGSHSRSGDRTEW